MADDALSIGITANVKDFLDGMAKVQTQIESSIGDIKKLGEEHDKTGKSAAGAGQQIGASASQIGLASAAWTMAFQAAEKLGGALVSLGKSSIEAATFFDPSAALAYSKSTDHVTDGFKDMEAVIGKQILPVVEKFENKLGDIFSKLAHMPWGALLKEAEIAFDGLFSGLKSWSEKVLDVLTYPIRAFVGYTEQELAQVMGMLGKVLTSIGSTSIGKKLGLSEFSGDALIQTATDMEKQAKNIKASFSGALGEVATGFSFSMSQAIGAMDPKLAALAKHAMDAFKAASSSSGPTRNQQEIAAAAALEQMKMQQQRVREQMATMDLQQRIAAQHQAAVSAGAALNGAAAEASQRLQQAFQQLSQDRSSGNAFAIGTDLEAVKAASKDVAASYNAVADSTSRALADEKKNADDMTKRFKDQSAAWDDAIKKANAAQALVAGGDTSPIAAAAAAKANTELQQAQALMLQTKSQMMAANSAIEALKTSDANAINKARLETEHAAAQIQMDATKAAAAFYKSQLSGLGSAAGGSAGGAVIGGAVQGAAAAGPIGAAAGAGLALLEQSQQMQDLAASVGKMLQGFANAIGQIIEPLTPVIDVLGDTLAPLFQGLGDALTPIMKIVGEVLTPVLKILAPYFKVVGTILQALAPVLNLVATILKYVLEGVAFVWNGILAVLEGVFTALAHFLPGGAGDAMWSVVASLKSMEIHISDINSSSDDTTKANKAATDAVKMLTDAADKGTLSQVHLTQGQAAAVKSYLAEIDTAASVVPALAAELGDYTDRIREYTDSVTIGSDLQSLNSDVAQLQQTLNSTDAALKRMTDAADSAASNAEQKVYGDQANLTYLQDALSQATAQGNTAVAAQLRDQIGKTSEQLSIDQLQYALDVARAAEAHAEAQKQEDLLRQQIHLGELQAEYLSGAINSTAYADAVGTAIAANIDQNRADDQAIADAQAAEVVAGTALVMGQAEQAVSQNATSLDANTQAVVDLNTTLTNAVSGFRVQSYEYAAAGVTPPPQAFGAPGASGGAEASSGGSSSGPGDLPLIDGSGHVFQIQQLTIQTNDPDKLGDAIDKAARKKTYRRTGKYAPLGPGRYGG